MDKKDNAEFIKELLGFIDPAALDYEEWLKVGFALKQEGFPVAVWDEWSKKDGRRYHPGECGRKWSSFTGSGVTGGTIYEIARSYGFVPVKSEGRALDWNDTIGDDLVVVNRNWIEGKEITEPQNFNPKAELIRYLSIFDSTENVGYVTETWEKDGRYMPTKGVCDRTAGELIEALTRCDDICDVIGDYNHNAGAWIRFNPLDGAGVKNENVTDFRYALVESDNLEVEKQNAIIRELELPVAMLVYSGGKSLHAIVRIDAANYDEYRSRVDYLYSVCQKNGLTLDKQNRNPSRLSRMPGIERGERRQFIVDSDIGKSSFVEWREWIESVNDSLPDPETLSEVWEDMPPLSPCLIDGILRQGHKMLLAGPSKAGKSFSLIELTIAIAEGVPWLGRACAKGRVMYINLELDRPSCLHRFRDVYRTLGIPCKNADNIDIWNLRGNTVPMDKLAPKLIRRACKKDYIAVIIDPIYKVITGDENSAAEMSYFCNQFDKICTELGTAVIYCHHHSKGVQGGKRSMDRASGSGVFARDPDALLDLIELEPTAGIIDEETGKKAREICLRYLADYKGWEDKISYGDLCRADTALAACREVMPGEVITDLAEEMRAAKRDVEGRTAWRIECTLREFPKPSPINLWFDYPIHRIDTSGLLAGINPDAAPALKSFREKREAGRNEYNEKQTSDKRDELERAVEAANFGEPPTVKMLAEYLGMQSNSVYKRVKRHGGYEVRDGLVVKV